jgi:RHS repeat-associated protein
MKPIVRTATLLLVLFAATAVPVVAVGGSPTGRFIVVLKSGPGGASGVTDAQIATLGGSVEIRLPGRLEVTLSDHAAEVLREYPAVKYLQRVLGAGESDDASHGQISIMRLHPKVLTVDPPSWTSGTFKYDGSGNIYAIGVAGESGVTTHTYTYDALSRLIRATNVVNQTETFYYDEYGNMNRHDVGSTTTTIALDPTHNNRLQTTSTIQYDAIGNLTSDDTATYAYDPFSQLREKDFSAPAGTTDKEIYLYTPSDERIAVKQNDTWTWSIRDFDGKVLRQYQSSASQPAASWLWMEDYVYRDGLLLGADRPAEEGGRRYMHLDHLGTPRLVTGANGVKVAEHELAPFGIEPTPLWEDTTHGFDREDPMRFTGHERDFAQLSRIVTTPYLDYMHARFYNANVGRFLSVDLLLGDPRSPQTWNRYTYAANNPINRTDPTGKCEQKEGEEPCSDGEVTVTANNPSDEEHFLFLVNETKELDLPFMGDWSSAHLFPNTLWSSYETKQQEKLLGHPVSPGAGVLLIGMALVGRLPAEGSIGSDAVGEVAPWSAPAAHEMRMSRWMSETEATAFQQSGNLQIGAGNRTFMTEVGAPKAGNWGPVRMDFNVPAAALEPGGQAGWYFIGGWNRVQVTGIVRAVP